MFICVCLCECVSLVGVGQKRALDALEVELKIVVSHLMWVLGPKLGSSARAVYALNH